MTRQTAKQGPRNASSDDDGSTTASSGGEATTEDRSTPNVSRDAIFDALKNSRRRLTLQHLYERGEAETVNHLVDHVAALENDTTPAELTSDQRKRVYVGLYQSHLPRLDDMEFVEFDQSAGTVELGAAGPALEQYLCEGDDGDEGAWYQIHLAYVALTAVVLAGAFAGGLVTIVGATAVLAGIGAGVGGLAAYQWRIERE
ncbi:DUF7344 domain-containing protein [Salinarchaeum laminariae]|uniref:DUF7344 domain-containing protein n=1 Tax=Salinarchaeum laminariae TaxID=869888 RepID=UPI0020BDBE11|nr:ArsR family transcriptional regulator [Salinarchaeum laminariae]